MCDLLIPNFWSQTHHELMPANPIGVKWAPLVDQMPVEDESDLSRFLEGMKDHETQGTAVSRSQTKNTILHYAAFKNDDLVVKYLCTNELYVDILEATNLYGQSRATVQGVFVGTAAARRPNGAGYRPRGGPRGLCRHH